jgi:hypothetical protein
MWMGGWPPLGYEVENRRLVVVEHEAALVRRIFDRFAKTGSALTVARELNAAGEVTKRRVCPTGVRGGRPWTKGAIYKVLANRVYLGEGFGDGSSRVPKLRVSKLRRQPDPVCYCQAERWLEGRNARRRALAR